MSTAAAAPDAPAPRRRRVVVALLVLAVVIAVAALAVRVLLPPERALRLALGHLGPGLGLEIGFDGDVDYRLGANPQLVVHDAWARPAGEAGTLLQAERVLLSLPWKTIRSRGADLEITRVELDAPRVHLPALLRWLDARPAGDGGLPAFTDGLRVRNGVLDAGSWRIEGIAIDVPALHADRALDARVAGSAIAGRLQAPFDLRLELDRVVGATTFAATGRVAARLPDGRLDADLRIDAARVHADLPGVHLAPLRIAANAHWRARATSIPFALGVQGRLSAGPGGGIELAPVGIATRARGLVPTLAAGGRIGFDDALRIGLQGRIADWPEAWPALPAPLSDRTAPLPFALRYDGPPALAAPIGLRIEHPGGARFDGSARLPDLLHWLDAMDTGSPLPPLQGRLTAGRVEVSGATLEGLEIDFGEGGAP